MNRTVVDHLAHPLVTTLDTVASEVDLVVEVSVAVVVVEVRPRTLLVQMKIRPVMVAEIVSIVDPQARADLTVDQMALLGVEVDHLHHLFQLVKMIKKSMMISRKILSSIVRTNGQYLSLNW
jgi:hypothetical protein